MPLWRKKSEIRPHIDLWALVAVFLVLLIIMMVYEGENTHDGVSVDNPTVEHAHRLPKANREDAIIVSIFRDGKVFLGSSPLPGPDSLSTGLQAALQPGVERRVYIRADARAKFKWVRAVLTQIQAAGIENVTFFAENKRAS